MTRSNATLPQAEGGTTVRRTSEECERARVLRLIEDSSSSDQKRTADDNRLRSRPKLIRMQSAEERKMAGLSGGASTTNFHLAQKTAEKYKEGFNPAIRNYLTITRLLGKYYGKRRDGGEVALIEDGTYCFVRMPDTEMRLSKYGGNGQNAHGPLSGNSMHVLYAGEVAFKDGEMMWFSNRSGTYLPEDDLKAQSGFDADELHKFVPAGSGIN